MVAHGGCVTHMWNSEDNFQESFLPFQYVGSWDGASISQTGGKRFHPPSHLASLFQLWDGKCLEPGEGMLSMPLMNSTVPWHGRCFMYVSCMTLEQHSSLASLWHYRLFREPDDPEHCSAGSWIRRTLLIGCTGLRAALWVLTSGLGGLCCSLDSSIVLTVVTSVLQKSISLLFFWFQWYYGWLTLLILCLELRTGIYWWCLSLSGAKCPCNFLAHYNFYI